MKEYMEKCTNRVRMKMNVTKLKIRYVDRYGKEWILHGIHGRKNGVDIILRHPKKKYVKSVDHDRFLKNYTKIDDGE
jgi:hypothetical protein